MSADPTIPSLSDPHLAARNRALRAREHLVQLESQRDRERRELKAARERGVISEEDAEAVEALIRVTTLRVNHAANVAELYELIAKGHGARVLK